MYYDKKAASLNTSFQIDGQSFNYYDDAERFRYGIRRVMEYVEKYDRNPNLMIRYREDFPELCCCGTDSIKMVNSYPMTGTKEQKLKMLAAMIEAARD